jgi:hypothetical protein
MRWIDGRLINRELWWADWVTGSTIPHPETYRTSAFDAAVGFVSQTVTAPSADDANITTDMSGIIVCGSPDEIANDPTLGGK